MYVYNTNTYKMMFTDIAKKAEVFSTKDVDTFLSSPKLSDPYWLVRKIVVLLVLQVQEQPKQQYLTTPVTSASTALHHTDQTVLSHSIGQPGLFKSIENNNKVIVISNCHGVVIN